MDRQRLINDLKIDRPSDTTASEGQGLSFRKAHVFGVAALAIITVGVFYILFGLGEDAAVEEVSPSSGSAADQTAGIEVAKRSSGSESLDAVGYVVARRQATVSSPTTGKLVQVAIEEGQYVTAGQMIAQLDNTEAKARLRQAIAERSVAETRLAEARVSLTQVEQRYERMAELHNRGFLSNQQKDDILAELRSAEIRRQTALREIEVSQTAIAMAKRDLEERVIRAPFAGVVTNTAAQVGEIVSPSSAGGGFTRTGICTIVDMQSLEVEVDVAERFINRVSEGMSAEIVLNSYPELTFKGEVIAVIPTADRAQATVGVRVRFLEIDPRMIPQMGVRVTFSEQS